MIPDSLKPYAKAVVVVVTTILAELVNLAVLNASSEQTIVTLVTGAATLLGVYQAANAKVKKSK